MLGDAQKTVAPSASTYPSFGRLSDWGLSV
jgi:hypothetical protein